MALGGSRFLVRALKGYYCLLASSSVRLGVRLIQSCKGYDKNYYKSFRLLGFGCLVWGSGGFGGFHSRMARTTPTKRGRLPVTLEV